jgi:Fe2+ transport system protein B
LNFEFSFDEMSESAEVKRARDINKKLSKTGESKKTSKLTESSESVEINKAIESQDANTSSFHLTRIVLVRFIGFIYAVAFLIALNQNVFLFGKNGLKPVNKYLKQLQSKMLESTNLKSSTNSYDDFSFASKLFMKIPTLLWFVNWNADVDTWLDIFSTLGKIKNKSKRFNLKILLSKVWSFPPLLQSLAVRIVF